MLRIIFSILIFAAIGFGISYYLFARIGDSEYISLQALFLDKNALGELILKFGGIDMEAIRTKILIATGIGALIGAIAGAARKS